MSEQNFDFWRLRQMCKEAGFANSELAARAITTGSSSLLRIALGRTVDALSAEKTKAERAAAEAEEKQVDELARLSQEFAGIISDPTRPDLAPELSRDELRAILRDTKCKEQTHELVGDELAALEREVAESMRSPGQPIEQILD